MSRELLSPEDARILALESATVRGHTCKVIVVAGERNAEELRARIADRLDAAPQLTWRLAPSSDGPPAWDDDADFSLERHVSDRGRVDDAGLRRLVCEAMETPLDRGRPLWAIEVVPLSGARTALVWRIHHTLADGMTAMRIARDVLFDSVEDAGAARRPARSERGSARSTHTFRAAARTGAELPLTLRRELGRRAIPSPLDRPVGPRREVAFVDAPLDQLRRIGHAAPERATVNDVALSAVSAGLRAWLEYLGAAARGLRAKIPVSLHQPGEHDSANRDSFMVVDLPVGHADPVERLMAVSRATRECKRHHDAESLDSFFRDVSHLSRSLRRQADHWAMSPRVFTLNVSNVPGPQGAQAVLGARLLELHSIAEVAHHHALRVSIVSASGRISFGLCADADAVDRLDVIADGIERELQLIDP